MSTTYTLNPSLSSTITTIPRAELAHRLAPAIPNRAEREVYLSVLKWYDRAKHVDETGRRWLIRTASEFIADGVLYTEATIRRALRRLAEAGLLVLTRGRHLFRKRRDQARNCSWIALPERACDVLSEAKQNVRAKHVPTIHVEQEGSYTPNRLTPVSSPKLEKSSADQRKVIPGWGIRKPKKKPAKGYSMTNSSEPRGEPRPVRAADIFARYATRRRPEIGDQLNSFKLHRVFAVAYKSAFDELAGEPLQRDLKQWNAFISKAREFGLSDPEICEVVESVVSAWRPFGQWLADRKGWKITSRPTPVFFYQQHAEVANYFRARVSDVPTAEEPVEGSESLTDWLAAKGK